MYATTHPTLVGVDLGSTRSDICVWDGAQLAVTSVAHEDAGHAAVVAALESLRRTRPRRPSNLILTASRADLRLADLAPLKDAAREIGAAALRCFLPDGTQVDHDPPERILPAQIPSTGTIAGALGAIELARSTGTARATVVEGSRETHVAFSHELAVRRTDSDGCRAPVDVAIEQMQMSNLESTDFTGQTVVAYGPSADAVARRARARGAARVLVPANAGAWRAVGLVLVDPVIDFGRDLTVPATELDEPTLRRMHAELMECAAASVQAACYEQDDAALYRFIVIDPDTDAAIVLPTESRAGYDRCLARLRGPTCRLRLTTRAVIATMRPPLAQLVDATRARS